MENALRERAVASLTRVDEEHLLPLQPALPSSSHTAGRPSRQVTRPGSSTVSGQQQQGTEGEQGQGQGGRGVAVVDGASGPGFFHTAATTGASGIWGPCLYPVLSLLPRLAMIS